MGVGAFGAAGDSVEHFVSGAVWQDRAARRAGQPQRVGGLYAEFYGRREADWKAKLGADVNWRLSFEELKETDTTKHVHRLHPYKGKFIPQLVEYFLDSRTDEFKREAFFRPGDIVFDPFSGSGTTVA